MKKNGSSVYCPKTARKKKYIILMCICGGLIAAAIFIIFSSLSEQAKHAETKQALIEEKESAYADIPGKANEEAPVAADLTAEPEILSEYSALYEQNSDMIGWLKIDDTVIDYPVMQTPDDEEYYIYTDFYGEDDKNGCLIMDTDSTVGSGTKETGYINGTAPSTNLIIHGHNMKSGEMFGNLTLYEDEEYGKAHHTICFDSLYEKREYKVISVFYSQVFYQHEDVFKFYKFFRADTQVEFDDWYDNIMEMSLYDTGVTAEFGDEFITLTCCSYQVEDGRFVVVGKRIK